MRNEGSKAAYYAIPDLLSELNDVCALIALDGLRGLDRGARGDMRRGLKDGSKMYKVNEKVSFIPSPLPCDKRV